MDRVTLTTISRPKCHTNTHPHLLPERPNPSTEDLKWGELSVLN